MLFNESNSIYEVFPSNLTQINCLLKNKQNQPMQSVITPHSIQTDTQSRFKLLGADYPVQVYLIQDPRDLLSVGCCANCGCSLKLWFSLFNGISTAYWILSAENWLICKSLIIIITIYIFQVPSPSFFRTSLFFYKNHLFSYNYM